MITDFALNLRLLVTYYSSIAEVCRRIDLNRQQFNKYLSGQSRPSPHNMRKICDFFGVEDYELLMPETDFREIVIIKYKREPTEVETPYPGKREFEKLLLSSRRDITRYLGYYFSYRYSFSNPDLILKSLVYIWKKDDVILSKRIERFSEYAGDRPKTFICKYIGYALFLGDRLFIMDKGTLGEEEVGETVLYPCRRNQVNWLSGLNIGVSTSDDRKIGCGQVIFQYLGQRKNLYSALKSCGKYPCSSLEIPKMVCESLGKEKLNMVNLDENHRATIFASPL
ncbi:MAG: helix-turn-helix transcriptional regulator [Pseudomonas marincola]